MVQKLLTAALVQKHLGVLSSRLPTSGRLNRVDCIKQQSEDIIFIFTMIIKDQGSEIKLGIDKLMIKALDNGTVLSGGSAGFISLCNGGHSDSMEPDSFKNPSNESSFVESYKSRPRCSPRPARG